MKRILAAVALVSACCLGADFSGNWTGKADLDVNGERSTVPVLLILQQDGSTVTGTAGPNKDERLQIINGKAEGDTLTFQVQAEQEGPLMTARLTLKGGRLVGTVNGRNADAEVSATLDLQKEP